MDLVIKISLIVMSYLVGSVPTGVILTRWLLKTDVRQVGSGNIGATNVMRAGGKKLGIMTLVGDALKGALPVIVAKLVYAEPIWHLAVPWCALAAFLGHLFPVYLRFKGGKGVATALGIFLTMFPVQTAVLVAIFAAVVWKWRYVSLGSITCAAIMPFLVAMSGKGWQYLALSVAMAVLVIWKHEENIHRLLVGRENKVFVKGPPAA